MPVLEVITWLIMFTLIRVNGLHTVPFGASHTSVLLAIYIEAAKILSPLCSLCFTHIFLAQGVAGKNGGGDGILQWFDVTSCCTTGNDVTASGDALRYTLNSMVNKFQQNPRVSYDRVTSFLVRLLEVVPQGTLKVSTAQELATLPRQVGS